MGAKLALTSFAEHSPYLCWTSLIDTWQGFLSVFDRVKISGGRRAPKPPACQLSHNDATHRASSSVLRMTAVIQTEMIETAARYQAGDRGLPVSVMSETASIGTVPPKIDMERL